ncbi:2og-Fe oxygenase family protein [Mollisia scopiformis]|uniref:2og-Fe oxygenase family protein n=1 Tax=Mollisia scopiformis TaxID=149040 RepID=A0A194XHX4_MOLSC|nr:2og-Fe oxygenase family protein [Mollisia scopiformis]KUJ19736.1 2og-Fe oxygenase family protein [Mollisia scopiformis]
MADILTSPPPPENKVYFHSGSTPTYRLVTHTSAPITAIPTLDISQISSPDPSIRLSLAKELVSACSSCGFFYLTGHSLSPQLQTKTFDVMKRFFDLSIEEKMDVHVQKNPAIRGYEPRGETKLDPRTSGDIKESFTLGDCPLEPEQSYHLKTGHPPPPSLTRPQNIWPSSVPWFRAGIYEYYNAILPIAMQLVRLLALGMGVDEEGFVREFFEFPITGMRPLHYPPVEGEGDGEGNVGLGAHSDFSYLTLVLQTPSLSALEVLTPTGQWISVPALPNTLVCNVGQYLERQSNGRFLAAVHRVRNKSGEERYSLPFFLTMDHDADVEILVKDGEERKFEDFNVGDLYIRRVLAARGKHPTSIKYRDVLESEWKYDLLLG